MKNNRIGSLVVAGFLILVGLVALLNNMGIIQLPMDWTTSEMIMAALFGAGGLIFLIVFITNTENWWAVIPGMTLIGLATLVGGLIPEQYDTLGGAVFMGFISLSFWIVFFVRRENWWALIPAGVLLSITALIAIVGLTDNPFLATGIFFWGMALTFVLLMVAKVVPGAGNWPMYPAGVLAILGTFMFLGAGQAASWLVGIVLIVLGVLVIWRGYRK